MESLSNEESRGVLGEVLNDQLQAILEYVKDIPKIQADICAMKADIAELKSTTAMHELDLIYIRKKLA